MSEAINTTNSAPSAPSAPVATVTFDEMRLKVGDRLQVQVPIWAGGERHIVKLIGYVEGVGLLVTAPTVNGTPIPLRPSDKLVIRTFSNQNVFGFDATVEYVSKLPYNHLHLSFPARIEGQVLRKSPRIRTDFNADIVVPGAEAANQPMIGMVANLSASGALIKSPKHLFDKDAQIELSFRTLLHDAMAMFRLNAIVQSAFLEDDNVYPGQLSYNYGVQFRELSKNDNVLLRSLIYQRMVEQPQCLS